MVLEIVLMKLFLHLLVKLFLHLLVIEYVLLHKYLRYFSSCCRFKINTKRQRELAGGEEGDLDKV